MADFLKPCQAGREYPVPVSGHTVTRHITVGVKIRGGARIKLRAVRSPSGWLITEQWIQEFHAALTAARGGASSSATMEARARRADSALAASGW
jgi:hypothetical protein